MNAMLRTASLLILLSAAGSPAAAQSVDVRSLPGDTPGDKVAFQFSDAAQVNTGQPIDMEIPIPEGSAFTIETITVRAFSNARTLPEVSLHTFLADNDSRNVVALIRKGIAVGAGNNSLYVYEGTHSVRLRHRADVRPYFQLRTMALQGSTGSITFRVSVAGYVTAATRTGS